MKIKATTLTFLVGGLLASLLTLALKQLPTPVQAMQIQPTGWALSCNGTVVCIPAETPTPIVPIASPTRTPTATRTNTPTIAPSATLPPSATPTAQTASTPTKVSTVVPGSCTIPASYPCILESNGLDYTALVAVNIRSEYRTSGGSATVVGQRKPGDHVIFQCFVYLSAAEIWGSAQGCGAIAPNWTAILYNGVQYMVQSQ